MSKLFGWVPPAIGWIIAAMIAWSIMGARVAVLEEQGRTTERRMSATETDVRNLQRQLAEVQGQLYYNTQIVTRIEQKVDKIPARR